MDTHKLVLFIDKIIERTKSNKLEWMHLYKSSVINEQFPSLNSAGSFYAVLPDNAGTLVLGRLPNDDTPDLYIIPAGQTSFELFSFVDPHSEDYDLLGSKVDRLYKLVYYSLPSFESFLDDFLNS